MSRAGEARADVVFSGGGTGGHVYPALAIAERLHDLGRSCAFIGTPSGMESSIVARTRLPYVGIEVRPLKGRSVFAAAAALGTAASATAQARKVLQQLGARVVVCSGGYVAGPVGAAAASLGLPLLLVEPNAVMGLTNRWLTRVALAVVTPFDGVPLGIPRAKRLNVGVPIRPGFEPSPRVHHGARETNVLVLGGSQGAHFLNECMPQAFARARSQQERRPRASWGDIHVVHQTGLNDVEETQQAYTDSSVTAEVHAYIHDMPHALQRADLVIARSGAGTVAEVCAVGRGALFVPLPGAADDHQTANAQAVAARGGATVLAQSDAGVEAMARALVELLSDGARLDDMARAAATLGRPQAAASVALKIDELLSASPRRRLLRFRR